MTTALENGIRLDRLVALVDAVRDRPEAGVATARVTHRWDDGFGVDGRAEMLEQGGTTQPRSKHTFRTDWPEPWGADSGPTPGAECLLAAIGACVATTYVATAALRGVSLDELEVTVEGEVDLGGLFDVDGRRAAFSDVAVDVRVHAAAGDDVLEEIGRAVTRLSPVYQSVANPVPVSLAVRRLR